MDNLASTTLSLSTDAEDEANLEVFSSLLLFM